MSCEMCSARRSTENIEVTLKRSLCFIGGAPWESWSVPYAAGVVGCRRFGPVLTSWRGAPRLRRQLENVTNGGLPQQDCAAGFRRVLGSSLTKFVRPSHHGCTCRSTAWLWRSRNDLRACRNSGRSIALPCPAPSSGLGEADAWKRNLAPA